MGIDFFDLHCDTLSVAHKNRLKLNNKELAAFLSGNGIFVNRGTLAAFFIPDGHKSPRKYYREMYSYAVGVLKNCNVAICRNDRDIEKCISENAPFCVLSVENGNVLEGDPGYVRQLYNDGIRSVTLTWNGENELASGCAQSGHLTPAGVEVVKEMNRLNMAVDLSHINEQGFFEALELAEHPVCTHTACKDVFYHRRNLSDEQLKSLCAKGGLVGLCFFSEFLGKKNVFDGFYAHLSHLLDMGFKNNAAIGSDFDGCATVPPLKTDRDIPALIEYLLSKNVDEATVRKVFFLNSKEFITNLLTNA